MKELEDAVTLENTHIHAVLPHINSLLHNAVLACRSMASSDMSPMPTQFRSDKIPSNKNMEHQWRFQPTTKAPGRKKKGQIFRLVIALTRA